MQTNPIRGRTDDRPDRNIEHELLALILKLHPTHLTSEELLRDLGAGEQPGDRRADHEQAIRDLIVAGLLLTDGDLVVPTCAALTAEEVLARSLRGPERVAPTRPSRTRTDEAPGLDVAQWLWLLKDCEADLEALIDDAENRGIGEGGARDMIVIRALIRWLKGGDLPGTGAIGYLERVVKTVPPEPDEDELAERDVYLAAIAELGGDEAAASRLWWEPSGDGEERRRLLDLQGRTIRSFMEERGLSIGEVAERTGIDTVTLVSIVFGLVEMKSVEWIRLSEALDVPLDRFFDEDAARPDPAGGETGEAR